MEGGEGMAVEHVLVSALIGTAVGFLGKVVYDWIRNPDMDNLNDRYVLRKEFEAFKEGLFIRLESIEKKLDKLILDVVSKENQRK